MAGKYAQDMNYRIVMGDEYPRKAFVNKVLDLEQVIDFLIVLLIIMLLFMKTLPFKTAIKKKL